MFVLYYLKDMVQLLMSPLKGWEDVSYDGYDAHRLYAKGFLPLAGICALSVFCRWIYHEDASVAVLLQQAVMCFVKYVAGFYIAKFFFSLYMPVCTDGDVSVNKYTTFIVYGLGLLALLNVVKNCVPLDVAVLYLMPMYVFYVLWRGLRYLSISFGGVTKFLLLCFFALMMPPYLLQMLFNLGVPQY